MLYVVMSHKGWGEDTQLRGVYSAITKAFDSVVVKDCKWFLDTRRDDPRWRLNDEAGMEYYYIVEVELDTPRESR